jgi:hypothetical protein
LPRYDIMSQENLALLEIEGLINITSDRVKATSRGRLVLNAVIKTALR